MWYQPIRSVISAVIKRPAGAFSSCTRARLDKPPSAPSFPPSPLAPSPPSSSLSSAASPSPSGFIVTAVVVAVAVAIAIATVGGVGGNVPAAAAAATVAAVVAVAVAAAEGAGGGAFTHSRVDPSLNRNAFRISSLKPSIRKLSKPRKWMVLG